MDNFKDLVLWLLTDGFIWLIISLTTGLMLLTYLDYRLGSIRHKTIFSNSSTGRTEDNAS